MASNAPGPCCVVGVKHDGEVNGQIETIGNGIIYACFINYYKLNFIQLTKSVEAYVSYPVDRSTKRAILLLSDALGHRFINSQLIADQLAANGYFVVMPDLFHGDPVMLNRPANFDIMSWLKGPPGHLPNRVDPVVSLVLKEMRERLGCQRIGLVGYCFGVYFIAS